MTIKCSNSAIQRILVTTNDDIERPTDLDFSLYISDFFLCKCFLFSTTARLILLVLRIIILDCVAFFKIAHDIVNYLKGTAHFTDNDP